jgi:uncharacterized membrane protein
VPAVTLAGAPARAATATYTITDLGTLGGGMSNGLAINALGQVTGDSTTAKVIMVPCEFPTLPNHKDCPVNLDHAFLWSNGTMTDLGTLGGNNSQGTALNDSGEVIGTSELKTGITEPPFLSIPGARNLTALSGVNGIIFAVGITDSDQISGECTDAFGFGIACVVTNNGTGTVTQFGAEVEQADPNQITCNKAVAVNSSGQVLASCGAEGLGAPFQGRAPVIWTNGTPTVAGPAGDVVPLGFNNNDQVIGFIEAGSNQGWVWSNGTTTDLSFVPTAINDSGVIVGGQSIDTNGTVQNLNTLIPAGSGYQIDFATGINDNGQILADAATPAGQTHAVILTPN